MIEKIESQDNVQEESQETKIEKTLADIVLLTPADIAKKFGVSVRSARQLFQEEGFPMIFIGNKYFCVESSFVKWCEDRKNDS